jgi:hypothetical protein
MDREHMQSKINWLPVRLGQDYEADLPAELAHAPDGHTVSGFWAGHNTHQRKEFLYLQLLTGTEDPADRMAVLIGTWTLASGHKQPLLILKEHVADAAAFLGFEHYEAFPIPAAGKTVISEEPQ